MSKQLTVKILKPIKGLPYKKGDIAKSIYLNYRGEVFFHVGLHIQDLPEGSYKIIREA